MTGRMTDVYKTEVLQVTQDHRFRRQRWLTTTAAVDEAVKLIKINKRLTPADSAKIEPSQNKADSSSPV